MDEVTNETPKSRIGDMEFTDEELKRFVEKHVSVYSSFPESSIQEPTIEVNTELDGKEISDQVREHFRLPNRIDYSSLPKPIQPEQPIQPKASGYGVSVAMLAWSLAFLLFPKFAMFPMWLAYCFYIVGFVALLIGILGLSIEVFKGKQ